MCIFSKNLFFSILSTKPTDLLADVKIVPVPADSTVTITAPGYTQIGNGIKVPIGTIISWEVKKDDYETRTGSFLVAGDSVVPIKISEKPLRTLTIVPVPADVSVIVVGDTGVSSQGANAFKAPVGSRLTYTVSDPLGQLSLKETGTTILQEDTTINVTMRTKVNIAAVTPQDATVKINGQIGTYRELPCNQAMTVSVAKDGYDTFSKTESLNNRGIVPDFVKEVSLKRTTYNLTIGSDPEAANISLVIDGKSYTGTGRIVVNSLLPGTSIKAKVSLGSYDSVEKTIIMPTSNYGEVISLNKTKYNVSIASNPSSATIKISVNGVQKATGTGSVTTTAYKDDTVSYVVTYSDQTASGTITMPASNYSKNIVLDAEGNKIEIVTSDKTAYVAAGKYRYMSISGGGPGGNSVSSSDASSTRYGGGGGGSGYVSIGTFTSVGENITFKIGSNGGATSIKGASSGVLANINGGSPGANGDAYGTGGNGGCGGGGGGIVISSINAGLAAGAPGGTGGYNAPSNFRGAANGGTGVKNTSGTYANNGGRATSAVGYPGGGGSGASSLLTSISDVNTFKSLTADSVYAAMGGGGGGGGCLKPKVAGSGGGGGAWTEGADGNGTSGGNGGTGVVVYMRIGW